MTTDFGRTCPFSWDSPCLAPGSKACCWKRCVKRKSNDGSGQQVVEGFIMPRTEGNSRNLLHEPSWSTMPQIDHSQKDYFHVRKNKSSDVLQNEHGTSFQMPSRASKSGISLHKPCLTAENETAHCSENSFVLSHFQGAGSGLSSKKRVHVAISDESVCASDFVCDKNEVLRLREALKSERKALRKLYKDLEEERCASAEAANQAMAMIRRLQAEKSAALVESRQYRLASEERETYNQEAIDLLKEAVLVMENEVQSLQERVEAYRSMLSKLRSREGDDLEGTEEAERLLLLEGRKTTHCSLVDSTEFFYNSQIEIADVTEEQPWCGVTISHHHPSQMTQPQGHDFAGTHCEAHKSETINVSEAQDLDAVSMSILARVSRLEERFASLGHEHIFDSDCSDQVSLDMTRNQVESEALPSAEQHSSPAILGSSLKQREVFVANNQQDLMALNCSDFGSVASNPEIWKQERGLCAHVEEPFKIIARDCPPKDVGGHELLFADAGDSEAEHIYDVFEVQCDPNSCAMPSFNASCKSRPGSADVGINSSLQAAEEKRTEGLSSLSTLETTSIDSPTDGKFSTEVTFVNEEAIKSSAASEDVHNLKLRLQALEGERAFMKVAIDSLRKENMELKLLQDIAQQLRELKGDVWKTGVKGHGHHEQLPFLSFIKGILSFSGMQSNRSITNTRFFHTSHGSSKSICEDQGQPGLFHLLNNPTKEERLLRVMRECKVKLGSSLIEKTR